MARLRETSGRYVHPGNRGLGRIGLTYSCGAASFAKLQGPVLPGDEATIIELRWPEWEHRLKHIQTVFPPSLNVSGDTIERLREGYPKLSMARAFWLPFVIPRPTF